MNPQPIRLKLKYRIGFSSSLKSPSNNTGTNKHRGINAKLKAEIKPWKEKAMLVDAKTGKRKMIWTGRWMRHTGTSVVEYKPS